MKRFLIFLVKVYSTLLSPVLGNNCRYVPSCSSYMTEAIERFGAAKGTWMGIKRISRCHPFHEGGFDPVPGNPDNEKAGNKKDCCSHDH